MITGLLGKREIDVLDRFQQWRQEGGIPNR
jgi:hypothetical protein